MIDTRNLLPFLAALLLAASPPAIAQTGVADHQSPLQVKNLQELDDDNRQARWNNLTVDDLDDMDIVDASGEEIGEVDEVLGDSRGGMVAVTAEIGGFLGIGDKEVIVGLDQLELQGDRLMTRLTRDQLEALPRWDDD
ncbi:MAG: PRC-barrel domain-containing protein [Acetobacterales bacterium]